MWENADLFEEMAIGCMQTAAKTDRKEAAVALDCQLRVSPSLPLSLSTASSGSLSPSLSTPRHA